MSGSLDQLLQQIVSQQVPSPTVQPALAAQLGADPIAAAFGATPDAVSARVEERSRQLRLVYPDFIQFCQEELGWQDAQLTTLWTVWLPLAHQIAGWHQQLGRPLIQGILGGQGTGKTTLAKILSLLLSHQGLRVCALSIDDLYKTHAERSQLQQADPRFRWRGPPGTHDVDLGISVLQQVRQAAATDWIELPRFDKSAHNGSGDRTQPDRIQGADILLFEGWFVGVRPIDPTAFETAPPPIASAADREFARDVNAKLQDYVLLWDLLDRLIVLYPKDFSLSQQWRKQAEQQMRASGRAGMSDAEIEQFVEYFWRSLHPELFITPLLQDATHVDLVLEIDANHQFSQIYRPA
jgi:D-glycerate 3-kinase